MMAARRWRGRRFSDAERMLAFQRILEGVSYVDIAAELDCSLKFLYREFGTQRDRAAKPVKRSSLRLSAAEREEISRGLQQGASFRALALLLGRSVSTISCEVMSNGGRVRYRAWRADDRAVRHQRRPRAPKLVRYPQLRAPVERLLPSLWSPQQINLHLSATYAEDVTMRYR